MNIILLAVTVDVIGFVVSGCIIINMLILGINEMVFAVLVKCSFDHSSGFVFLHLYWQNAKLSIS